MDDYNVFNDTQETVVEPQETEAEATSEVTDEVTTEPAVEPAKPQQTVEENARFAAARRQAEAESRAVKAQNERLLQALKGYGYDGDTDAIADALMAQQQGISPEEARAQREEEERYLNEIQQKDSELEIFKNIAREKMMVDDLNKLKSAFVSDKKIQSLKSIEELDNEFFILLGATKDPVLAYDAYNVKKARETKPTPQDIGAVNSTTAAEKDFYTPAEVDRLTDKDLDNPKIREAVRKSMYKWK